MSSIVLVVDFQESFDTSSIEDKVRSLTKLTDNTIISLKFKNREESIFEAELNYKDSIEPELPDWLIRRSDKVFERFGYDGTRSEDFSTYLLDNKIEACYVVGVETDACVLSTAMSLLDMGIQPIVIKDCCTTEASDDVENSALNVLRRNIGDQNVVKLEQSDLGFKFDD